MARDSLTDLDIAILDLEAQWWATAGGKENAIRAMGLTPTRYYQLLNRLLATEKALAYAAVTASHCDAATTTTAGRLVSRSTRQRITALL